MFYRLQCTLASGQSRGYQWREIDLETFVCVASGAAPVGDTEAQQRDSTEVDSTFTNSTVHYGAVWIPGTGWVKTLTPAVAEMLYTASGSEKSGA